MNRVVAEALSLWDLSGASTQLVAARENAVYRVLHQGTSHALRLHRQGYRTDPELRSELAWMDAAATGGLTVPAPVASSVGVFLHVIDDIQVDILTWLPGAPLSVPGGPLTVPDRAGTFRALGVAMAQLHDISDNWKRPPDFERCSWDGEGLLGDAPLWGRFQDNPGLSPQDRNLMLDFRTQAKADLERLENALDYGLIHADLVSANVMINEGQVALIDFDDGGFGFRLFEIATALLKLRSEPDYPDLHAALLAGYRTRRDIDTEHLDLFLALRAVTYVGWNITRMHEEGGNRRNARFIKTACELTRSYLARIA